MDWKKILKGLGNAAINGTVGALAPVVYQWATTASTGTPAPISGKAVGYMAAGSAILGVINYILKSPRQTAQP